MLLFNHDLVRLPQMSEFTIRKEPKAPVSRAARYRPHAERPCSQPLAERKSSALESFPVAEPAVFERACGSHHKDMMFEVEAPQTPHDELRPRSSCGAHAFKSGAPHALGDENRALHSSQLRSMGNTVRKEVRGEIRDLVMDTIQRMATIGSGRMTTMCNDAAHMQTSLVNSSMSSVPSGSSVEERLRLPGRALSALGCRSNAQELVPPRSTEVSHPSPRALSARGPRADVQELLMQRPPRISRPLPDRASTTCGPTSKIQELMAETLSHPTSGFSIPKDVVASQDIREERRRIEIERARTFEMACTRRRHWDEIAAASRVRAAEEQRRLSSKSPNSTPGQKPILTHKQSADSQTGCPERREVGKTVKRFLESGQRRVLSARAHSRKSPDIVANHGGGAQSLQWPRRPHTSNAVPIKKEAHHEQPEEPGQLIPIFKPTEKKPPTIPADHLSHSLGRVRNKLSQSMPRKQSLDMRIRSLRKRRRERASTPTEFELIPGTVDGEERSRIRETFQCYDGDGSGSLDTNELRGALADLGYCPQSREEKLEFQQIMEEVDREGDGELDINEFEQAVVRVMTMLRNLQRCELFEQFQLHDVDSTGSLSIDEVFDILPELGLAPRIKEERQMIRECIAAVDVDDSKEVEFKEFEQLLVQVREGLHRMRRERRRSIIHQSELAHGIVEAFKNEICELKDQFDRYDRDHSGFLDRAELNLLIADCGLGPRSKTEREEMQALIDSSDVDHNAQVTFQEFLHLILGIRGLSSQRRHEDLQELFSSFDQDGSGSMSLAECSRLLENLGLSPKTRQEQRHIAVLLEAMDEDGSGELDFDEFAHLCQRVQEMLQLVVHHEELQAAKSLHITATQLQEYKSVFHVLDPDESGKLTLATVRGIVDGLHIHISGDDLYEIFAEVDEDGSGAVEFSEFLKLISMVNEHVTKSGQAHKLVTASTKRPSQPNEDNSQYTVEDAAMILSDPYDP